jgi:uncharacterized iron-regulated membrane protein
MSCLTGLPLIFHDEIDNLLVHHIALVPVAAGKPLASLDAIVESSKRHYPNEVVRVFDPRETDSRVILTMVRELNVPPSQYRELPFDAHTGALLDESQQEDDVMNWVLKLHEGLFAGLPGGLLMGLMALLFAVAIISGGLVYGPFMRRLNFGTLRREMPSRVKWLDLHNLLGIVTLAWAVVVGVTGMMNALSGPLFDLWRAQEPPPLLAPYQGKPMPEHLGPIDARLQPTHNMFPHSMVTGFAFPDLNFSSPRHDGIWTKDDTSRRSHFFTPILLHARAGEVIKHYGLPWYLYAIEVSRPLHFGDYGGLPLKVLWALLDLATIVVLVSGLCLWFLRRRTPIEAAFNKLVASQVAPRGATRMKNSLTIWGIYRVPIALALLTIVGLICGELADGVWDIISCIGLGVPVFVIFFFMLRPATGPQGN